MALRLFKRKKRRKKAKVKIYGAPPNHASGKVSPKGGATGRGSGAPRKKKPARKKMGRRLRRVLLKLAMIGFIIGALVTLYFIATLPDIRDLNQINKEQGITIETADGRIVATYGDVYGAYIPYEKIPRHLLEAVIATEDRRFFQHHGIDVWGIMRAMMVNVAHGRVVQGGSTITQQVAKNIFLTNQRSLRRKIQEVLLAFWLESRYSKKEIMEIYLNRVYLGSGAFGIDAASRRYFNKPATDINIVESAMLAGLLKAPSRYAPTANSDRAMARARQVMLNMADFGSIEEKQITPMLKEFAALPKHTVEGSNARYFTDWVVDTLPEYIGKVDEDIVVVSTVDPTLQALAADTIENMIGTEGEAKKISQGALVSMTPQGEVKAMIGGVNYGESQYNRAFQAKRQPGSSFKIFTYLAALEAGYQPMSQVEDAPITIQVGRKFWSPNNYSHNYRGMVTMTQGFRESLNTVAVRLSQYAGPARVAQMAMRLGIPNVPVVASIALGSVEATLTEMTGAYAHLANQGNKVEPYGILEIRTTKGEVLYRREQAEANPVLASGTVNMMNYMLLDVVRGGTGTRARLPGRDVAGKTGTSQDYKDAWFIGFTPQLVTGVWLGNDNNKPMAKVTGGSVPAMIWHDFMLRAVEGMPVESIPSSAGSSEGLLPWLFGGTPTQQPAEAPIDMNNIPIDGPSGGAPMDSPFGYVDQPPRAPADGHDEVLTPAFWNKLVKETPKGKVEYDYPGDDQRR
jgi:penicillin-binding protein 1A